MRVTSIRGVLGFTSVFLIIGTAANARAQFYRDAYFEAECPDSATGSYRTRQSAISGYSGSGYLRSGGNTTATTFNNTSSDHATYTFKARHKGWFSSWFRLNTNNSTADDSFFYRLDGGDWMTMSSIPGGSGWRWVSGGQLFLGEGNHTLEIANREDGFNIDKFGVLSDGASAPTGLGGPAYNCPTPVYFESECRTSAWGEYVWDKNSKAGYSGTGYLEAVTTSTDVNGSSDEVVYPFESAGGSYNLFFRIHNNSSASSDSWFYSVDNGAWVVIGNTSSLGSGWRWAQGSSAVTLARGDHTLRVRNREAGLSLDKIGFIPSSVAGPASTSLGGPGVNCETFRTMSDWDYFDVQAFADTHTNYMAMHGQHMLPEHVAWHDRNGAGGECGEGCGTAFLGFHRAMLNDFRRYALENGGRNVLPIDSAGRAVPASLPDAWPALEAAGFPDWYSPRQDDVITNFGIPSYLTVNATPGPWAVTVVDVAGVKYSRLGDIPDLDTLGRAIASINSNPNFFDYSLSYHVAFHTAVGGTMTSNYSPSDPVFYGWHMLIDRIVDAWLLTPKGKAWAAAHSTHRFLVTGFTNHDGWNNTDPP